MKNLVKAPMILGIAALCSAVILTAVRGVTTPRILARDNERRMNVLHSVLPLFEIGDEKKVILDGREFVFWKGIKFEGWKMREGYAFIAGDRGLCGGVKSLIGVDSNGVILGMSIIKLPESFVLGERCMEIRSGGAWGGFCTCKRTRNRYFYPPWNWFQDQFSGLNCGREITVVNKGDWNPGMRNELLSLNAISAVHGAPDTADAVAKSIGSGYVLLKKAVAITEMKDAVK